MHHDSNFCFHQALFIFIFKLSSMSQLLQQRTANYSSYNNSCISLSAKHGPRDINTPPFFHFGHFGASWVRRFAFPNFGQKKSVTKIAAKK